MWNGANLTLCPKQKYQVFWGMVLPYGIWNQLLYETRWSALLLASELGIPSECSNASIYLMVPPVFGIFCLIHQHCADHLWWPKVEPNSLYASESPRPSRLDPASPWRSTTAIKHSPQGMCNCFFPLFCSSVVFSRCLKTEQSFQGSCGPEMLLYQGIQRYH